MAWEWVAPVVTGVVSVAGTTGTVIVATIGRRQVAELARLNAVLSVELAREERRAAVFVRAVQLMQKMASLYAFGDGFEQRVASPLSAAELNSVSAEITAYGDLEIQLLFAQWSEVLSGLTRSCNDPETTDRDDDLARKLAELQAAFSACVNATLSRELITPAD